ncbi:MAG: nucleotidyltransferase domain-containing protein [Balneolales bacterium]|nr:nucleotidyltransferase domain-containing protein [Balneolales bacterium]
MKTTEDTDTGLKPHTTAALRAVFARYPEVERVILYGSRAKGSWRRASDIDLTMTGKALDRNIFTKIWFEIDDLLLPWKIDLSVRDQLTSPELIAEIEKDGILFYERESSPGS